MELLLDDSLRYLYEAGIEINRMQDIDEFSLLFEADSQAVTDAMRVNANAGQKGEGLLTKAINAIKSIITKVIDGIRSFFQYSFASKQNKAAFQQFKQACLADPSLKDKTITYMDYRKTMQEYDNAIAEAEKYDQEIAQGKQVEIEQTLARMKELASGVAGATTMAVSLSALENIMDADQGIAEQVFGAIKRDERILGAIESTLGKNRANKFDKKASVAAGQRISLRRAIVLLRRRKETTLRDVLQQTAQQLQSQFSSKWGIFRSMLPGGITNDIMHNRSVKDLVQGVDEPSRLARDATVRAVSAYTNAHQSGKGAAAVSNVMNTFGLGNQNSKAAERQAAKAAKTTANTKRFLIGH